MLHLHFKKTLEKIMRSIILSKLFKLNYISLYIVIISSLIAVGSRLIKSGTVYGLNFGLFHPDGINYLKLTQDITNLSFQTSTIYAWSRPLYPAASAPFYMLFGKYGMLVVPILSLITLGIIFISFGKNENEKRTLALCFLILTSSSTVLRWTVADLTDSLHLTLFALCCLGIYKNWSFRTLAIIIVFGAAIRPMGPVWAALFIPFLIRQTDRSKKAYFYLALISIVLFLVNTILMALFGGFAPNSNPLFSQIAAVPRNFFVILFVEFGQLAVLDRLLFYTVLLTLGLAILNYRDIWSLIHINVSFACFLISAWVGVWGVNFRYELPLLVTGTLVVLRKFNSKVR
jgi:hypothetical protein